MSECLAASLTVDVSRSIKSSCYCFGMFSIEYFNKFCWSIFCLELSLSLKFCHP